MRRRRLSSSRRAYSPTARTAHREIPDAMLPITEADAPALATIRSVGPAPLGGTKGRIRLGGSRKP